MLGRLSLLALIPLSHIVTFSALIFTNAIQKNMMMMNETKRYLLWLFQELAVREFRKKMGKTFGASKRFRIFAASNHTSGLRTAGITSSLFYAHTYRINGITTPCPEPGNRPGVSASMNLTARSVVFILSNHTDYEHKELFCAREQNGASVLLPAPGVEQVPQVDECLRAGALQLDGTAAGAPHGDRGSDGDGAGSGSGHGGRCEREVGRLGALPGSDLRTAEEVGVGLHPHRACRQEAPGLAAAHHRLSRKCGLRNQSSIIGPTKGPCRRGLPPRTVHRHWCGSTRQPPFFTKPSNTFFIAM